MRKVILLLLIMAQGVYANSLNTCQDCLNSLKLSEKQKSSINDIEKEYALEMGRLNAHIILLKMEKAQLKPRKNSSPRISTIGIELEAAQKQFSALEKDKESEIISNLGFFQKIKYKKCCKAIK